MVQWIILKNQSKELYEIINSYTDLSILFFRFQMNKTLDTNDSLEVSEQLEDFEVFDLRDAVNVAAYSLMSASKTSK